MKKAMQKIVTLIALVTLITLIAACGKSDEAKRTETAINDIGTVTLDSAAKINEAAKSYEGLTPEQKQEVENYQLLKDAHVKYVELSIDAIGEVTINSKKTIASAREAYDALAAELQPNVSNLTVLTAAEEKFDSLNIVGTWEGEFMGATLRTIYKENGEYINQPVPGKDTIKVSGGTMKLTGSEGTYTFDGTTLTITSNGKTNQNQVSISGDTLVQTVQGSSSIVYKRVE